MLQRKVECNCTQLISLYLAKEQTEDIQWPTGQRHLMKSFDWHMVQFGCNNPWTFCSKLKYPLLEKGETSSCQTVQNEIVKKPPLTKHFTCWILFILETVINDLPSKCAPPIINVLHLGSGLSIFCCCKINILSLAKPFQHWTLDWTSWLIDLWTLASVSSYELSQPERPLLWWEIKSALSKTAAGGLCLGCTLASYQVTSLSTCYQLVWIFSVVETIAHSFSVFCLLKPRMWIESNSSKQQNLARPAKMQFTFQQLV